MSQIPLSLGEMKLQNLESATISALRKNEILMEVISNYTVKDKRNLFQYMKMDGEIHKDTLFPRYGVTAGEFCTYYLLTDDTRKRQNKNAN
jgi:hypothetical protein